MLAHCDAVGEGGNHPIYQWWTPINTLYGASEQPGRTLTVMMQAMELISNEARTAGLGGALYVDSIARGLIIHLLRRYAGIRAPEARSEGALTRVQERIITEYIDANLARSMDLKCMADVLGLTSCLFARQFRRSFGKPPYAYVTAQRLERARHLLATTSEPIKGIALDCGFSDQAHLTRMFRAAFEETPAVFRRQAQ